MHEVAPFVAALRHRLRYLLPRRWLVPRLPSGPGRHMRQPARARMELDPTAPAASWSDWEVCRRPGSGGRR